MRVIYFHRKKRPGNYSIETLFSQIRANLPKAISYDIHEMRYFSEGFFKRLFLCFEAMRNQKDVNHVTGDIHFVTLFLQKSKTILTIHDIGLINHSNIIARYILKLFWITLPIKRSAIITTVSEATKSALLEQVSVPPQKIRVIYNPVQTIFTYNPKVFNQQTPTILQIGTKANKNIPRLIEALRGISCNLDIVGIMTPQLFSLLQNSGINYQHSQGLTQEELFKKYISADIVSFVSTYEGFGLPIIEGNSVGRVVITSNLSSMPEVAGNAAHFVDPFDVASIRNGIIKIVQDDTYRKNLIENGLENSKRFHVKTIARQYAEVYNELDRLRP